MSISHTPGPWFVGDEDEDAGGWQYTDVHAGAYCDPSFVSVAHVQGRWDGDSDMRLDDTTRANARLIAAAPELLAALEGMVATHGPGTTSAARHSAFLAARAAISQATSRQPEGER